MKKYFVMLLSAAIAFSSCACGGETTEKTEEKKTVKTGESVPHRTGDEIVGVSDKDVNGKHLRRFLVLCRFLL